jgi:hypothetical protein
MILPMNPANCCKKRDDEHTEDHEGQKYEVHVIPSISCSCSEQVGWIPDATCAAIKLLRMIVSPAHARDSCGWSAEEDIRLG